MLFRVADQSFTLRDKQIYENVLVEVFKKKQISNYSKTDFNDFLVSRLSLKEAEVFQLNFDKKLFSEADRKKIGFTKEEVEREVLAISKAQALIDIKENQHRDATRFNSWFELMKRKYVVRIKTTEIK